jgi:hypothetical protein
MSPIGVFFRFGADLFFFAAFFFLPPAFFAPPFFFAIQPSSLLVS